MNSRLGGIIAGLLVCLSAGIPARAQIPDATNSYYVPQVGPVATPTEGSDATRFFRACPNNDGGASLPNSARIKVVLKDDTDTPIAGVSRLNIYIKFNGGTAVQGFFGDGADSVIANGVNNTDPECPLLQYLYADADTDIDGVTYITFAGADPLNPGVTLRDSNRKWGHFDSTFPVFADGVELQGRLTGAGTNGDYVLRIRNFDFIGGLANGNNQGEVISSVDYNSVKSNLSPAAPDDLTYWRDFDESGVVNVTDFNMIVNHMGHDCGTPNSP